MRIFYTLLWGCIALACAAPTCDTHPDGWAAVGSGSGATSGESTLTGSAKEHDDVIRAMESVTGAKLDHPTNKPSRLAKQKTHDSDSGGGNYGRSQSPSPPPPPPKPRLPESGRLIGQACEDHEQCASDYCDFDVCTKKSGGKLSKGEKCDYQTDCASNRCYEDKCE
jgi:hypothetical protein